MCIDLKSFYASVECIERNLDSMTTNLVVADPSRTEKTICLAVSPSLKSYGIGGRARLYEVIQKVKDINLDRKKKNKYRKFEGKSYDNNELLNNSKLELDFISAPPRMSLYVKYSIKIYNIYLKYIAAEDIHVYSIDEVFCDITNYLNYYRMNSYSLVTMIIKDVYETTGITATAGLGTNLYLAKIAMDIVAKHANANEFGVRMSGLTEYKYKKLLWDHTPITDFWRVGEGYAKRLADNNMYTMGDVARCSLENEELLFKLFGINAEILIDHAWGYEPCTLKEIKEYKPSTNSLSSGQVLHEPYDYKKAKLIVKEMLDLLVLDLVDKKLVTDNVTLTIGYDVVNIKNKDIDYDGEIVIDRYGRKIPKHSHGTARMEIKTSSTKIIMENVLNLYDRIINKDLFVRRINISANNLVYEDSVKEEKFIQQFSLFTDSNKVDKERKKIRKYIEEENKIQKAVINIKKKYGKNAILKGMNLEEGATTIDRNSQIGGHRA